MHEEPFTPLSHYYKRTYFSNHHCPQSQALRHLPFSPLAENFLQRALYKTPGTASLSPLSPLPNASGTVLTLCTLHLILQIRKAASSKLRLGSLPPRDFPLIDLR